jgi:hypothetical protein
MGSYAFSLIGGMSNFDLLCGQYGVTLYPLGHGVIGTVRPSRTVVRLKALVNGISSPDICISGGNDRAKAVFRRARTGLRK